MSILGISGNQDAAHARDQQAGEATGYRNNAATGYGTLGTLGAQNTGLFGANTPGLINGYEQNAGIQANGNGAPGNPYALTPDQQTLLNGQVDDLSKRQNTAIEQLRNSLASKGITDPRYIANAEANIRQGFGGLISQHQAAFGEQAKTDRQTAYQNLLQYLQGVNQTGTGQTEASASGLGNLASGAQSAANASQQQQNQSDANFNNSLGGLTNLVGFGTGGGFGSIGNIFGSGSGNGGGATSGSGSGSGFTPAGFNAAGAFGASTAASNPFADVQTAPTQVPATSAASAPWGAPSNPWNFGY